MSTSGIYSGYNSYGDNLARGKRRRFFIRILMVLFCGVVLVGAGIYMFFYSGWLDITQTSLNGLTSITGEEIYASFNSIIQGDILPILDIQLQKNIFFFNPSPVRETILAQFPVIKDIKISKDFPHSVSIDITERTAIGTWCFNEECMYFDEEGVLWGKALKSSGTLLLIVDDLRLVSEDSRNKIDNDLLEKILKTVETVKALELKVRRIEITQDSIGDFKIYTMQGYYLTFNTESDIDYQINILRIFLDDKPNDFRPEYIDLRVEGRIYYK